MSNAADSDRALSVLEDLIAAARAAGADGADAVMYDSTSLSLSQRLGQPEKLERAESTDIGLRVVIGRRQAIASSADPKPPALAELVERAVAMARAVPEDRWSGLADSDQIDRDPPTLDIADDHEPDAAELVDQAKRAEEAALAVDGITNSDGAEALWYRTRYALVASNGFAGSYALSRRSLRLSVIAGSGTAMERDYEWMATVYGADLMPAEALGKSAAERAVRRLNPKKAASRRVPVVYEPRVARGLIGHLTGAISGPSVARGTSFLKDKLGQPVFADRIAIVDDPHLARGLRSRPFDGEGLATRRLDLVAEGRLATWLLDLRSARQLGLTPTGHASRGTSTIPHPTPGNVFLAPGECTPEELIGEIADGFYVTELMGQGVNGVTGDYSRGAAGFWIENGQLGPPVSEVTIAGNLVEMFRALTPANDLVFRYGIDAPHVRIAEMTVAGT